MSDRWGRMTRGALARFCRSAREPLSLLANPLVAGSHTASGHPCRPSAVLSPCVHREVARMPTRHAPGRPSLNARSKHLGRPPSRLPAKGDASDLPAAEPCAECKPDSRSRSERVHRKTDVAVRVDVGKQGTTSMPSRERHALKRSTADRRSKHARTHSFSNA